VNDAPCRRAEAHAKGQKPVTGTTTRRSNRVSDLTKFTPVIKEPKPPYWSDEDIANLVRLAGIRASTVQIAIELGRTPKAIRNKASSMGLALTAYAAKRQARRRDREEGAAALNRSHRKRRTLTVTVDFDISSLTRDERLALAARLLEAEPEERSLVIPKAYDPSEAGHRQYERWLGRMEELGRLRPEKTDRMTPAQRRLMQRHRKRKELLDAWRHRQRLAAGFPPPDEPGPPGVADPPDHETADFFDIGPSARWWGSVFDAAAPDDADAGVADWKFSGGHATDHDDDGADEDERDHERGFDFDDDDHDSRP